MDRSQGGKEIKARGMVSGTMRVGNLGRIVGKKVWVLSVLGCRLLVVACMVGCLVQSLG